MTDPNEQAPSPIEDMIDFTGGPQTMGEQRDYAFKLMKQRMLEVIQKKVQHVAPLMRGTALSWYERGMDDAFKVFAQITEQSVDEELAPG